jgi:hypothetical protein
MYTAGTRKFLFGVVHYAFIGAKGACDYGTGMSSVLLWKQSGFLYLLHVQPLFAWAFYFSLTLLWPISKEDTRLGGSVMQA